MKFTKKEASWGTVYGSILSLSTPVDIYKDPKTSIRLSLTETRDFIDNLATLLQVDSIKDTRTTVPFKTPSGRTVEPGTSIWISNKEYSFSVVNDYGGVIDFNLTASDDENVVDKSMIKGSLFSSGNYNYFTVNNYDDYRRRVGSAVKRFRSLVNSVKQDKSTISLEEKVGTRSQVINYEPITQNGFVVLKSHVHNTSDLQIIADITLERTPRRVSISEYRGQFERYELKADDQLNYYVQEELDYSVFIDELLDILGKYDAKGILDPKIVKNDDSIVASFSVFK
ncbi:hypothetical protein NC796_04845 [Aliifodinibius sp. S!AR15-10]|uniref:hypothetical protein n=1 Tax=Aliifodinibius sp. S!AR15-10 TaxID=2950437 RepID=UPI002857B775|nr:hypothetical protein [Aliifodinibius sp. S!AR15-10]MDR8390458.1 hypothetical protein [Aliifodinibius sp. S!AR15-10]